MRDNARSAVLGIFLSIKVLPDKGGKQQKHFQIHLYSREVDFSRIYNCRGFAREIASSHERGLNASIDASSRGSLYLPLIEYANQLPLFQRETTDVDFLLGIIYLKLKCLTDG